MSKVSAIFHIVINTYSRRMTIPEAKKEELYMYIHGIIKNNKCQLLRINGIGNHIHILVDINPTISLSQLVQAIKQSSSKWLKGQPQFPAFEGWGKEYFAFSVSQPVCENVKNYIIHQEQHHLGTSFENEMKDLLPRVGFEWNDHLLT